MAAGTGIGMSLIPPSLYFIAPDVKKYAKKILARELNYLRLEANSIPTFVEEYFQSISNDTISAVKWKILYYKRADTESSDRINDLVKYFLLSTDFFIYKTEEKRTINYLGLFNYYKSPVPNPFSFLIYPPSEIGNP